LMAALAIIEGPVAQEAEAVQVVAKPAREAVGPAMATR
jgi:hypothetical protein